MPQNEVEKLQLEIVKLKELLVTDELTKVLNRRGLEQALKPVVGEVSFQLKHPEKRKSLIIRAFSLVFVDIDHFKKVNDTYGHQAGDEALRVVARILKENIRGIDVVGRYGGEEIVIGLLGASKIDAERIAEDLRKKIATEIIEIEEKKFQLTASFGVATLGVDMTTEELIHLADQALYKAKETGRNKVVVAK
ncbi:MAG TPA: GGDEF domain-containing protein [Candidatus Saccharimonadales bacterium]|nr:GGDEF domain-containing protein [Candidatus Saccharimonadales bacterium]